MNKLGRFPSLFRPSIKAKSCSIIFTHPTHRCAEANGFALLIPSESVSDSQAVQPEILMPQGVALHGSSAVNRDAIHFSKKCDSVLQTDSNRIKSDSKRIRLNPKPKKRIKGAKNRES